MMKQNMKQIKSKALASEKLGQLSSRTGVKKGKNISSTKSNKSLGKASSDMRSVESRQSRASRASKGASSTSSKRSIQNQVKRKPRLDKNLSLIVNKETEQGDLLT